MEHISMVKKFLLVTLLFFASGCAQAGDIENNEISIGYDEFTVKGMPCLIVYRESGVGDAVMDYDGVTCDWSKYQE